jgi:uncharacterized membrane protein
MDPKTPMVFAAARYATRDEAVAVFDKIWEVKHEGELEHIAAAVLTKNAAGELEVERHDSTAKHLAWGGAILGAALVVVAPPAGIAALATGGGALAGAGGIVGHFWHTIPKDDIQKASGLLDSGQSGLIVVAVNKKAREVAPMLGKTDGQVVIDIVAGDLDAQVADALAKAGQKTS